MFESFRVLSLNVRHFSLARRTTLLPLFAGADIVLLQETHHDVPADTRPLFPRSFFSAGRAASGGVAVLFSARLCRHVRRVQHVFDIADRALAVRIWLTDGRSVLCASLYAPSGSRTAERRDFLSRVFTDLAPEIAASDFVFVGGDLNCVRRIDLDRISTRAAAPGHQPDAGAAEIARFLADTLLVDAFRHAHPDVRDFTCVTERRVNGVTFHTESRLDYIFVRPAAGACTVRHRDFAAPNLLLDHRAVEFVFDLPRAPADAAPRARPFTVWRLSSRVLRLDAFTQRVRELLHSLIDAADTDLDMWHTWWRHKRIVRNVSKTFGAEHAANLRAAQDTAQDAMTRAANDLAARPGNEDAVAAFVAAAHEREQVAIDDAVHFAERSRVAWVRDYEPAPRALRAMAESAFGSGERHPQRLRTPDGQVLVEPAKLLRYITSFYVDLYTPVDTCRDARRELLAHISVALPAAARDALDRPLQRDELEEALFSYRGHTSSPGPDGLPYGFYLRATSQNAYALSRVAAASMQRGALPRSMMTAHLRLLPKSTDAAELENIRNWRPISLINTDVRVLSKAVATRLQVFAADDLLHSSQCGFVRGRRTTDCVLLLRSVMDVYEAARATRGCAVVFLDQYKAYDLVDHHYLFETLERFGFGGDFLSLVRALHCGGSLQVRGADGLGPVFAQRRGVRQGDPSSPLLYNFALEPLLAALRATLTPVLNCVVSAYADDVAVFLDSPAEARKLLDLLRLYERASGARLNDHKTRVLLLGSASIEQAPWRAAFPQASFCTAADPINYLGVQLGGDDPYTPPYQRASQTLERLDAVARFSSPATRVVCANTLVTSRLLYAWSHLPLNPRKADLHNDHVYNFVWGGKRSPLPREHVFGLRPEGKMGLLDVYDVVSAMQMRLLGRLLDAPPTPASRLAWAALRKTITVRDNMNVPAVARLKPPWLDASDDALMSALPQASSSVRFWQIVINEVFRLGADIRRDLREDRLMLMLPSKAAADWRPGMPIADTNMAPLSSFSNRGLRKMLHRLRHGTPLLKPAPTPADFHWPVLVPRVQPRPLTAAQHWRWVHAPLRRPEWRQLHFMIIHGAVAVNARLVHSTDQGYDTCESYCGERETAHHLFYDCPLVRPAWRFFEDYVRRAFATRPANAPPPGRRGGVEQHILTDLLYYCKTLPAIYAALNVGQACMLQAIWDVRNGAKFKQYPFTTELINHTFVVLVRAHLRYIARSLPSYMRETWAPPDNRGLFLADGRTFALDA